MTPPAAAGTLSEASYGDDSPIAAFASVPGGSALTLIRCSGRGSLELAAGVFSAGEKLLRAAGHTIVRGWIVAPGGGKVDEVLVSVFRAPKSYTGEDGLDISCHGGVAAGNGVMAALRSAGFRDALPGEFSFRAFMNGKLDLTRCESVMELVSAKTERGRRGAVSRLSGALENEINAIKLELVRVLAGAEIFLDYSEDEIGLDAAQDAGRLPGRRDAEETLARLRRLAETWRLERVYQEGVLAVIAGRPNAGKSSLFNLLLGEERSIVADVPGTTRDWIEAWISVEGVPVRLADTAGLRLSGDPVEAMGVERSRALLENAELVLYLIDGETGITEEDMAFIGGPGHGTPGRTAAKKRCVPVWNKADVVPAPASLQTAHGPPIAVSAKTGAGLAELTAAIADAIIRPAETANASRDRTPETAAVGTARQKNLAEAAVAALEEALALDAREEPLDLVAPRLREAVNLLGEITGEVSTADILEEMFGRFCVGK